MKFYCILSLTSFIFCFILSGYSQQLFLSGILLNRDSVQINHATVVLYRSTDSLYITGTVTDSLGKFSVRVIPGKYFMEVNHINYERFNKSFSIYDSNIDIGNLYLAYRITEIQEVVITGKKPTVRLNDEKSIYKVSEMTATQSSSMKEVLRAIPSLMVDFNDNVLLNGVPVRFLIDGREISVNELTAYSPSQIAFVELITNPTSKYDASGLSGIVQLITKHDGASGISGTVNISGAHDIQIASAGVNYNRNKFVIGSNFSLRKNYQHGFIETVSKGESFSNRIKADITHITASTNIDYNFDKNHTVSFSYQYINLGYWSKDYSASRTGHSDMNGITHQFAVGYNFLISDRGESFKANLYYNTTSPKTSSILDYLDEMINISNRNRNHSFVGTMDYFLPFTDNANFEAGIKAHTRNISIYRTDDFSGKPVNDAYKMEENILASYLLMNSNMENFNVQFGIRGESNPSEKTDGSRKWDIFLNSLISYTLNTNNVFTLGYNKRVNRPAAADINPFMLMVDPTSCFQGNPTLLPEYSHNFFLDYIHNQTDSKIKASAYYRRINNMITKIYENKDGVFIFTPVNLSTSHFYGIDFTATQNLSKRIIIQPAAGLFGTSISGKVNQSFKQLTSYYLGITAWFKLPYNFNIQLMAKYSSEAISAGSSSQSSIVQGLAISMPQFLSEFSVNKSMLNERLNFSLRVTDPFRLMETGNKSYSGESMRKSIYHMETRFIYLGFSYKFNNHKTKQKQYDDGGIRVF